MSEHGALAAPARLPAVPEELARMSPLLMRGAGAIEAAHELVKRLISRSMRVIVADCACSFDAYSFVRGAPRHLAPALLDSVRVSRAFTWQQQLALLERKIAEEALRRKAAWVVIMGPLDLLADNELEPWQACSAALRTAQAFIRLGETGMAVIAAQGDGPLKRGNRCGLLEHLAPVCRTISVERKEITARGAGRG